MEKGLTNILYTNSEQKKMVLLNGIKMIDRRDGVKDMDKLYKSLLVDFNDKKNFLVPSIKQKYVFYIIDLKITNINQINDVISKDIDEYKILFVQLINKKVYKQIYSMYKNVNIFFMNEFLEDIPSKVFIPEHKLLTEEQKTELLQNYKLTDLAKISVYDTMSRYLNASIGDIVRIKRYNLNSCTSIFYRTVVNDEIDLLLNKFK